MFHAASVHVPQYRRPSALRTFVTSSFSSPPESKEPVRRGILFMAVAGVFLLIGSILTWLGFNDVFGGKISMTGPLLIALALLLLLLSTRQFLKARKHSREHPNRLQLGRVGQGTLRAVVVDRNDRLGAVTVIMDSLDVDNNYANRHGSEDYAPPSYSEVAEINTTNNILRPYSNSDEEEPPPPYDDVIIPSDNMMTLHLPKYESLMGRRSPVPKVEVSVLPFVSLSMKKLLLLL
ncbi:hypothetical protein LOTGIDRAFT_161553 [Lottia gigantea]|uniref:Uncharacterized protein n=1 Tax=Lottia gigantea TaxID=225164 RepID=V4AC01_LOTGI|nr:hypothetical protein LOTGIDRAFT_161553 [Lottia gigantea]ESO94327.1 hypothetical protein LOTGIDRAFT_161553 [Lottia gigantea]